MERIKELILYREEGETLLNRIAELILEIKDLDAQMADTDEDGAKLQSCVY